MDSVQQFYTNGFFHGSGLGYQNGHLEGYRMAATEAHGVIAHRDQRIAQLEAILRASHHKVAQLESEPSDEVCAKIAEYEERIAKMERQWTSDSRVATDRLDQLFCAKAEILDLKDQHDVDRTEWETKLMWVDYDLQAARRAKHDVQTTLDDVQLELDTFQQHVTVAPSTKEVILRKTYLATAAQCDVLILKVRDLEKKNTNQMNMIEERDQHVQRLCDELDVSNRDWEAMKARVDIPCGARMGDCYREDMLTYRKACENHQEQRKDDQQAINSLDFLNRQLLDGIVSVGNWLGKGNKDNYKMMLVRGGAPEDVIEETL